METQTVQTKLTTRIIAVFGADIEAARECALDVGGIIRAIRSLPATLLAAAGLDAAGCDRRGVQYSLALVVS